MGQQVMHGPGQQVGFIDFTRQVGHHGDAVALLQPHTGAS
jgi:hypothetical protein